MRELCTKVIRWFSGLVLIGLAASAFSGCTVGYQGSAPVYVAEAPQPPPPEVEYMPPAPGPGYVWIEGSWVWNGRWIWEPGRWLPQPHPFGRWEPGHWERGPRGYIWEEGHWR